MVGGAQKPPNLNICPQARKTPPTALETPPVCLKYPSVPLESAEWVREVATHEGVDNWARSYGPGRSVPHRVMTDDGFNLVVGHIGEEVPSLVIMCRVNLAEPTEFIEFLARMRCTVRSVLPASWPFALMHVSGRGRSQTLQNR